MTHTAKLPFFASIAQRFRHSSGAVEAVDHADFLANALQGGRDFTPATCIDIPVRDPAPEVQATTTLRDRGKFLARQDAWGDLVQDICTADTQRSKTPGLAPAAAFLSEGARADVLAGARRGLVDGEIRKVRAAIAAIEVHLDHHQACAALHHVLAATHLDLARAWRSEPVSATLRNKRQGEAAFHLGQAARLTDMFDPFESERPLWAAMRCAVLDADQHTAERVSDDYEDLIDLDPTCPEHMTALGRDVLPRRYGSYEELDLQARRTAARLSDVWGSGGYTWVFIGALEHDSRATLRMDADFFVEGMHDILARAPDQHMVNRLAAFTGHTMARPSTPGSAEERLADSFDWLVTDHMHEIHPALWANAATPDRPRRVNASDTPEAERGTARALSAIAERFSKPLSSGKHMVFSPSGVVFERPS